MDLFEATRLRNGLARGLYRDNGEEQSQRVHVGIWYVLGAQRSSHIPTLRPKYIPYSYMDPLGMETTRL